MTSNVIASKVEACVKQINKDVQYRHGRKKIARSNRKKIDEIIAEHNLNAKLIWRIISV